MERYDFKVHRGETFHKVLRFKRNGEAIDLSGYEAKSQVRVCPDGGDLVAEMQAVITGDAGRVDLFIPADVTAGFESGVYAWDIRLTSAGSVKRYYLGGQFTALPSVTE